MTKQSYQYAMHDALEDLDKLMGQRERLDIKRENLDRQISQLREGIEGLAALCGTDTSQLAAARPELFPDLISSDVGLTDAVRKALRSERTFVSPSEVKDRLVAMGFNVAKYKNILASIHTILKRLVDSEEAETGNRESKVVYRSAVPSNTIMAFAPNRQVFYGGGAADQYLATVGGIESIFPNALKATNITGQGLTVGSGEEDGPITKRVKKEDE